MQLEAIRAIVAWYRGGRLTPQVFYLAGFAGVGKSTVYKLVLEELSKHGCRHVVTCAYTAKAASVLIKKGTLNAMTCHAALYVPEEDAETGKVTFILNVTGPIYDADLVSIDEGSMINHEMAEHFKSFGKKILVMGDPGQLPPISGAGAFTLRKPDFFLSEIHRQAADSPIIRLATLARQGKSIPFGDYGDGVRVVALTRESQELIYRPETQPICGTKKVRWSYSQRIRRLRGFDGSSPCRGEKLICVKNNREAGLINGILGDLVSDPRIDGDGMFMLDVHMDGADKPMKKLTVHPYHFTQHFTQYIEPRIKKGIEQFDWGYVLTCHKAQGSEFPDVTLIDDAGHFPENRKEWLYTGLTRASDYLTLMRRAA